MNNTNSNATSQTTKSVTASSAIGSSVDGFDGRLFATKKLNIILDDDNYLLWQQQVLLAAKTFKLQGYLDGTLVPPPSMIPDESDGSTPNPDFTRYEQQDSVLASWLLSSVSQTVLPHLIGMNTSSQIWQTLARVYGNKTTSKLMFYRRAPHSQRKGDLSMKDYLLKIKSFCDNLANCGEMVSEYEHVTAILNGLSIDFESVITIISASPIPYSVQTISTLLLDAEAQQQTLLASIPAATNMITTQSSQNNGEIPSYRPPNPSSFRGQGKGRSNNSRLQCQLCGKPGHLVDRCYFCFDQNYKASTYRPLSSQLGTQAPQAYVAFNTPQWTPTGGSSFMHNSGTTPWAPPPSFEPHGYWIYQTPPLQKANASMPPTTTLPNNANAYIATLETVSDPSWYTDSSATHHITHSSESMCEKASYFGL
ncbi:hypothetical protein Gogos_000001, partial [Gossypium gossypioides]|nr:hypothetical protein [Gossypium gossypioides]